MQTQPSFIEVTKRDTSRGIGVPILINIDNITSVKASADTPSGKAYISTNGEEGSLTVTENYQDIKNTLERLGCMVTKIIKADGSDNTVPPLQDVY